MHQTCVPKTIPFFLTGYWIDLDYNSLHYGVVTFLFNDSVGDHSSNASDETARSTLKQKPSS